MNVRERIPDATFYTRTSNGFEFHWATVRSSDLFAGKRILFFSLPGAFTPTCSSYQLPQYEEMFNEFVELGIDAVYCISVNDAFVMNAWGKTLDVKNIKLLPDGSGEFTRKIGMLVQKDNLGFGLRSWRYAAVIDDGAIEAWFQEEGFSDNFDQDPYEKTRPESVLAYLKGRPRPAQL